MLIAFIKNKISSISYTKEEYRKQLAFFLPPAMIPSEFVKESDLYLGDISIIDGNSVAIKSWEKAVLGNVREFESNSNDIFDIIMRELENDK